MRKDEFLRGLEEALAGEVSQAVIRENISYYDGYLSQEMAKGRTMDDIVGEIGEPYIVAKTIIDVSEAAGEENGRWSADSSYSSQSSTYGGSESPGPGTHIHYFDLNKWYWKLLLIVIVFVVVLGFVGIVGSVFAIALRFAGPIFLIFILYQMIRGRRR